jgi:hypothetical protein
MQEMWPTRLPHPQETLRSLWLRRDYKAATLLMAKQEDQSDTNSLEPSNFDSIRSLDRLSLGLEFTEEVAHDRSEMSALQPPDALES